MNFRYSKRKIALKIAYLGEKYHGLAIQESVPDTVEVEIVWHLSWDVFHFITFFLKSPWFVFCLQCFPIWHFFEYIFVFCFKKKKITDTHQFLFLFICFTFTYTSRHIYLLHFKRRNWLKIGRFQTIPGVDEQIKVSVPLHRLDRT